MLRSISILLFIIIPAAAYSQQQDSTGTRILKQWNLSEDFSEEVITEFDTVFSLFHRFRIADRYSPVNVNLGNYGLPFYQIYFFDRISNPDLYLYNTYYPVMYIPGRAIFMNTQVPFTEMAWSFAGPRKTSEQTFRVRHSQNVNRFLNFGLTYDIIYSLGQYNYQRSEDKNFTFYSSYTGNRYKMYFSSGINNMTAYENGGITTKDQLDQDNTRDVPVRLGGLNNAKSILKNYNLLLVQRVVFGDASATEADSASGGKLNGSLSHIFILENNKRTYSDDDPELGFYDSIYVDNNVTFDSLSARSIKNSIRFDFSTDDKRNFRLGGGIGFRNEILRYSQIIPTHTETVADTVVWNKVNNVIIGKLFNDIGDKFRWKATGEFFFTGYRRGDLILKGEVNKSFDWKRGRASWLITGSLNNRRPSFWYEQWGGNHFEWNNDLNREFRIDLGSIFSLPARKTTVRINYAIIDNYTDFDEQALPCQHTGGLSIAALVLSKKVHAWKLHLDTDLLIQKSSNSEILDLPLASIRSAGYFEHLFHFKSTGGRLYTQLGADVTFHTPYYPYSYMPATGRFYRQKETKTGNYPFIDLFVNLKVKRTRIFLMLDHINYGFMGNDYDMIPLYPLNIRMLRYGLAWTFYD